jgi:hypothetical protein
MGSSGSTGSSGSAGSSGSMYGSNSGTSGSASGSADTGNLRTVTGQVQKVDQNSITLDQGVTLTVDSQTQILRRGQPVAAGISAIQEGSQVRASFDPASNRAEKIEVMGKAKKHHKSGSSSGMSSGSSTGTTGSTDTGSSNNPK